jgi:deoxyribose-phosphate aldolase
MKTFTEHCHDTLIAANQQTFVTKPNDILALLDHTCLDPDTDTEKLHACWPYVASVAAICVRPERVALVKKHSPTTPVAAVVNFPLGNDNLLQIQRSLDQCLNDGVDEIDYVFPYQAYLTGDKLTAVKNLQAVRQQLGAVRLKVILETGQYPHMEAIRSACLACIGAGADFIKTSTGTRTPGATLNAAAAIFVTIQQLGQKHRPVGCKISGGIDQLAKITPYINLAQLIFGQAWLNPGRFRIGSSKLLAQLQS